MDVITHNYVLQSQYLNYPPSFNIRKLGLCFLKKILYESVQLEAINEKLIELKMSAISPSTSVAFSRCGAVVEYFPFL